MTDVSACVAVPPSVYEGGDVFLLSDLLVYQLAGFESIDQFKAATINQPLHFQILEE